MAGAFCNANVRNTRAFWKKAAETWKPRSSSFAGAQPQMDSAKENLALAALREVSCSFDDGRVVAVRDISLTIEERESVAIVGPSGSGKTTLIHLLSGIKTPTIGQVFWKGALVAT